MKLNQAAWAIVDEEGELCGDGECLCMSTNFELVNEDLPRAKMIQPGKVLRIARIIIEEVD